MSQGICPAWLGQKQEREPHRSLPCDRILLLWTRKITTLLHPTSRHLEMWQILTCWLLQSVHPRSCPDLPSPRFMTASEFHKQVDYGRRKNFTWRILETKKNTISWTINIKHYTFRLCQTEIGSLPFPQLVIWNNHSSNSHKSYFYFGLFSLRLAFTWRTLSL